LDHKTKHDTRSEATRHELTSAARRLFGAGGYAAVGTEEIVQAAGVTRGALYHHFRDKSDLFATVAETVEAEVTAQIAEQALSAGPDPIEALRLAARTFLELSADPEIERILLVDAPAVLGWAAWRELGNRYGFGLVQSTLQAAMDAEAIARQPVVALAHALIGALQECALSIAGAADPAAARAECIEVLDRLIGSL